MLFRILRLSHCLFIRTSNTETHSVYNTYALMRAHNLYTQQASRVACFGRKFEFARFQNAKTTRLRRFFQYVCLTYLGKTVQRYKKVFICANKCVLFRIFCQYGIDHLCFRAQRYCFFPNQTMPNHTFSYQIPFCAKFCQNAMIFLTKYLHMSIIFCNFALKFNALWKRLRITLNN